MQYANVVHSSEKIWKFNKCAQLWCTVHCGKFKPVDIMVIDKTDSLESTDIIDMFYQKWYFGYLTVTPLFLNETWYFTRTN